jgi:hypothetical protein
LFLIGRRGREKIRKTQHNANRDGDDDSDEKSEQLMKENHNARISSNEK